MLNMGVIIGFVITVVCIPFLFDRIKPNQWYGFRTPKTLSNPEIWYKANKYMAKNMSIAGMVIMGIFIILPLIKHRFDMMLGIVLFYFIIIIPILVAIIRSLLYLRKL